MPDAECSEREALAALACLRWAAPPALPPQVLECRRHAPPASTSSHSPSASACAAGTDSDCAADAECRPRKVRVLAAGAGEAVLQKRSYKWRGWRAEKQQRQLDALAAQQQHHQQEQQQRGGTSAAHSSGSTVAAAETPSAATQAAAGGSSRKEGDRKFAALTTWLRSEWRGLHAPAFG